MQTGKCGGSNTFNTATARQAAVLSQTTGYHSTEKVVGNQGGREEIILSPSLSHHTWQGWGESLGA